MQFNIHTHTYTPALAQPFELIHDINSVLNFIFLFTSNSMLSSSMFSHILYLDKKKKSVAKKNPYHISFKNYKNTQDRLNLKKQTHNIYYTNNIKRIG